MLIFWVFPDLNDCNMKFPKTFFIGFTLLILSFVSFYKAGSIFAQNNFTCANPAFTNRCEVGLNFCDTSNGYQSLLDNGKKCEDFSGSDCPTGFHPCQFPPSPTPMPTSTPIPNCVVPNSCQRGGCTNGAVPISGSCPGKEDVCCTPNSQQCYSNCLSRGDTPGECRSSCGISPPGGEGRSGNSLVNLDQLIQSMGNFNRANSQQFSKLTTLGGILTGLLPFLYGIAGIGLLLFMIAGGFGYLTSQGDPKKMEAAKGQITSAVIGFILVIMAYSITSVINYIFSLGTQLQ